MEAAVYICCVLALGLTAFLAEFPPAAVGVGVVALFGVYLPLTLRRRARAVAPLAADLRCLQERYQREYGHTRAGAKFLALVSKPLPVKSKLDESMNTLGSVVTNPVSFVVEAVLSPVLESVGRFVGSLFSEAKPPAQTLAEAALLHARRALDQRNNTYHHGILASAVAGVGAFLFCALVPPLEHAPAPARDPAAVALTTPVVAAVPLLTTPPPTPAATVLPAVAIEAPHPEPTPPEEVFATVAEAQREAVRRYPELGVAGSEFNAAFIARYQLYQRTRPEYFRDASWPVRLARELSRDGR